LQAIDITLSKDRQMLSQLYENRAECWLELEDYERALADANACICCDPEWFKVITFLAHLAEGHESLRHGAESVVRRPSSTFSFK